MFKKRTRNPNSRSKDESPFSPADTPQEDEPETTNLQELLLLRKLAKQNSNAGIDLLKLNQGEEKKKKKRKADAKGKTEQEEYGLKQSGGTSGQVDEEDEESEEDEASKARKLVRSNNFTQQTNALDVDKHMMAYIETELAKRRGEKLDKGEDDKDKPYDPQAELYQIAEKYRIEKKKTVEEDEGNVTTSLGMLTSIPEVDLGMDVRLKNIEETERAKRSAMSTRGNRPKKMDEADESFAAARFYRPQFQVQPAEEALEDAKREVQGLAPLNRASNRERNETATDDQVYERFKKRLRKN